MEREDGELEDGELDSDEDDEMPPTLPAALPAHVPAAAPPVGGFMPTAPSGFSSSPPPVLTAQGDIDYRQPDTDYRMQQGSDYGGNQENLGYPKEEEGEYEGSIKDSNEHSAGSHDSHVSDGSDDEGKRRRKRRDKKRKRKHHESKKKKKKYHDYDSLSGERHRKDSEEGNEYMSNWPGSHGGGGGMKRGGGHFGSPNSRDGSPGFYDGNDRKHHDSRGGSHSDRRYDPSGGRSPRQYGSPTYESEGEYEEGHRRNKYARLDSIGSMDENRSMLSMVGDDYFDANVAANEKQEMFDRNKRDPNSGKSQKKIEKSRRYKEMQKQREQRDKEREERGDRRRDDRKHKQGGDDNEFSHNSNGPQPPASIKGQQPGNRRVLCKHYMRGGCNRDWCVFMHGDYPCKYFFQNRCELPDDKCRFTHGELTDEFKNILDRDEREMSPNRQGQIRKPGQESSQTSLLGKQSGPPGQHAAGPPPHVVVDGPASHSDDQGPHNQGPHHNQGHQGHPHLHKHARQQRHPPPSQANCEPPAYVQEKMKKIPSLFDIKVEKPKGPTNNQMMAPGGGPPGGMSPNRGGPPGNNPPGVRPPFYNDMMGTPPRMGGPPVPPPGPPPGAPGILGPAPRPPMSMPPPGFMGRPPPPNFMGGAPPNFFPPPNMQQPPPNMMPGGMGGNAGAGMDQSQGGPGGPMMDNKENNRDMQNQNQGDAWGFGGDAPPGGNEQKPPPQPQPPGGNKIDIGAMLNMIRNSVVNASNAAGNNPQQTPSQATTTASRDPRASSNDPRNAAALSNDPRGLSNDPRSSAPSLSNDPRSSTGPLSNDPRNSSALSNDPRSSSAPLSNDPRSSGPSLSNDPRANRQDPRGGAGAVNRSEPPTPSNPDVPATSQDTDMRSASPVKAAAVPEQSHAVFGYSQNQKDDATERVPDPEKIINCSLSFTGGLPYILYKITLDVLRPMLPKTIKPEDPKFTDDPRIKRYGRVGETPKTEGDSEKLMRPRGNSMDASSNNGPPAMIKQEPKVFTPPKPKADSLPALASFNVNDAMRHSELKAASLPDGLKKPLIPLPKLLDPSLGRQLSLDADGHKKSDKQKSHNSANKSAHQPFSHRSDPRFRKKSKRASSGDGDSDLRSSLDEPPAKVKDEPSSGVQTDKDSGLDTGDSPIKDDKDPLATPLAVDTGDANSGDSRSTSPDRFMQNDTSEPANPLEDDDLGPPVITPAAPAATAAKIPPREHSDLGYATPLGYYSDLQQDNSYNSYNRPIKLDSDISAEKAAATARNNRVDADDINGGTPATSEPYSSSSISTSFSTALSTAYTSSLNDSPPGAGSAAYPGNPAEDLASYVPMKDMFKTIDPTASPFGSI